MRGRGSYRASDMAMAGYNAMRLPGDPTGVMTSQLLRYNIGGSPKTNRMRRTKRSAQAQLGMGRNKGLQDARINTFLQQLGQRAMGVAQNGRRRLGDVISRGGGASPTAAGQQRSMLQDLYEQFQKAHDEANAANESRYDQLISGLEDRRTRGLAYLDQVGGQMRADTEHQYRNMASDVGQSMTDRGLSGGSAAQVMQMGVGREKNSALNRINEELALQRLNVDTSLDKDRLDAIERRDDVGPSYEMLAQLAQQLGASQSQQGGGGAVRGGGRALFNPNPPQFAAAGGAFNMGSVPVQLQQLLGQRGGRRGGQGMIHDVGQGGGPPWLPQVGAGEAWTNAYGQGQQQSPDVFDQQQAFYWNSRGKRNRGSINLLTPGMNR